MVNTVTGFFLGAKETETIGDKGFKKRSFFLDLTTDPKYPNTPEFILTGKNVTLIDGFMKRSKQYEGDKLTVEFEVQGRRWQKDNKSGVITQLVAVKVRQLEQQTLSFNSDETGDDLPF